MTVESTEGPAAEAKTAARIDSFETFWPEYVRAHTKKATRQVHFVGTSLAMACVAGAVVLRRPLLLLAAPVAGYAFAWGSHLLIEKNRPATFDHPLWSLRADFVMWRKMMEGTMDAEVERVLATKAAEGASPAPEPLGANASMPYAEPAAATVSARFDARASN